MRSADIRRAKRRFWLLSVPMKTSEEDDDVDDDDDRFVYCTWVRGPFTQPPFSSSHLFLLPFSLSSILYLSIHLSLQSAFWVFCVRRRWAAGLSRSTPCAPVQVVPFSFAPCPPSCSYTDPGPSPTCRDAVRPPAIILYPFYIFSLCFPIPSDHLNTIFPFFLFSFSILPRLV